MEDPAKTVQCHWANCDPNNLKEHLKDQPALKLIQIVAERDAAIAERDTAIAEKKTAYAERDAAFLQRDVAYADRNAAWMERETAVKALSMVRPDMDNEAAEKLMQIVNMTVSHPKVEPNFEVPKPGNEADGHLEGNHIQKYENRQGKKAQKESPRKRKSSAATSQDMKESKSSTMKNQLQENQLELIVKVEKDKQDEALNNNSSLGMYELSSLPIPYCSCTGTNQQCYRWGKGGWQSACCTNFISVYPLPMNPTKRGSRVPGRKMSGGAFRKLLERVAGNGTDITVPVDLKNHWAKHGTNRYVTIR